MPLYIPNKLPAIELLKKEGITVLSNTEKASSEIRPLRILLLNLMPTKITTETDFIRLLAGTTLPVELILLRMATHTSKNTPAEHLNEFYKTFEDIRFSDYDGMIITGAPVELLAFEEVSYWKELVEIFDWAKEHVKSTLYICWAAQAGLYYFHGIPKYPLKNKMFGIFPHQLVNRKELPLFRGFDDTFFVPHSRHTEVRESDVRKVPELTLLSESEQAGVYIVMSREGREFYITGHSEYSPEALHNEYIRDLNKGLPINVPYNYYYNDDPKGNICVRWKSHAHLLFNNWLNHYVYPIKTSY
ncbi:homoserine O-succinyltransferase [Bacteroidales bacterium OttesenSCG-928-M11]|nr:homoserine O-succinyltransferase [Bacteroidales bacterium OttesenSCG-928-M11]